MFQMFDGAATNPASSGGNNSVRKRPRSPTRPRATSPGPMQASIGKARAGVPDGKSLSRRLASDDKTSRNLALNDLLRITSSHDINYALDGDNVLKALAGVFYDVIGWDPEAEDDDDDTDVDNKDSDDDNDDDDDKSSDESGDPSDEDEPLFIAKTAWKGPLTRDGKKWEKFCRANLGSSNLAMEDVKCLEAILTVFRNLSFVSANLRLLGYSNDVLSILVGCLYEPSTKDTGGEGNSNSNSIVLNALSVLINVSPHLDVTGQKLFCDKLFLMSTANGAPPEDGAKLPDPSTFGQAVNGSWGFGSLFLAKKLDTKEDNVQDIEKDMLLQLTQDYLVRVWAIFPALGNVLTNTTSSRAVTMMALELLQEFINQARVGVIGKVEDQDPEKIPDTRAILVYIPSKVLTRLSDFLYIPRLGSDGLEYVDPTVTIVTRVNPLKLTVGYDGTIDTDIRDRALEVLVPLLELDSPGIAKRLGVKPGTGLPNNRVFDAIFPILSTQTGRNDAPLLATQLLRELSKAKENRLGFLYLQERIIALASKEPRVAHLAFNHLYVNED